MKITNKIYGKILIPLAYYLRGDLRFWYYRKYKKNLKKTRNKIKEYQLQRLKKLIFHAYDNVPYYRELFDKNKIKPEDIKTLKDLHKIPPLTKKQVNNNIERLKSKKKYRLIECTSGGSTGYTVSVYKDKKYHEISRAVVMRDLYSVGIEPGDKVAWIWGSPFENMSLKNSVLHKLLWKINKRIVFNANHYSDSELREWLTKDFRKFKPDYIYGYANLIYEIAKFVKKQNITLPNIKKIICTAETLKHRKFIEEVFKCPVIDQYGCREIPEIAMEDENYVMHTADDFVIVEITKDNKLLLTPLESYGMPLLRYEIGDIGAVKKQKRHDKNDYPFNEFNITIGRTCELLYNKNHERISFADFMEVLDEKLRVGEFQIVQKSLDDVELNVVRDENTKEKDVERLKEIIKNKLGCLNVKVKYFRTFPKTASGKKIEMICKMQNESTNTFNGFNTKNSKWHFFNLLHKFKNMLLIYLFEPMYYLIYGKLNGIKYFNFLKKSQWNPLEKNIEIQAKLLYDMLLYATNNISYYKRIKREHNIEFSQENIFEDIKKFPVLTKDIINKEFRNLFKIKKGKRWFYNASGGSTGEPVRLIQDNYYKMRMIIVKRIQKEWAFCELGDSVVKLWGSERDIIIEKFETFHKIANWMRSITLLNSFKMDEGHMHSYIKTINKRKPGFIIAYAQSLYEFAKFIQQNNLQVHSPKAVMTSAGILYPDFKDTIERVFNCQVFNRYGSREVGDIASDCEKHEGLHQSMFTHYVEILNKKLNPCKEGETGDIYITLLTNFTMPLIRYKIGDMAVYTEKKCSCGRGLPLIKEVIGRDMDVFKLADGKIIPGEFFIHFIGVVFNRDMIDKFQVIQKKMDLIEIKVVSKNKGLFKKDVMQVENAIKKVMGINCQVRWKFVGDIRPTKSGKYRYTIREF